MSEITNVELTQMQGLPGKQITITGDPSVTGLAASLRAIGYDGTVYWQKYGTADTNWRRITGPLSYRTDEDYYKSRASKLMGSPRLTCWWWSDLLEALGEEFTATFGGAATWTTKYNDCGVSTLSSGGSGSFGLAVGGTTTASKNAIPGGTTGVWYICVRMKATGIAAAGTSTYIEIDNLDMGDFGVASQENWGMWSATSGGAQYSTVTNDQETHVHEFVRVDGITYYYLDEVLIKSGEEFYPTNNGHVFLKGASASSTSRITHLDFLCFAVGGNNPRTIT
jgi:hypothetical protein